MAAGHISLTQMDPCLRRGDGERVGQYWADVTPKSQLRSELRKARREHVNALPDATLGLLFRHPPAPLLEMISDNAEIGFYHAVPEEAPTSAYARFFHERGHDIALPHFSARNASMQFRTYSDPHGKSDLEFGPFGLMQPTDDLYEIIPDVLFVPLLGFTARGERLGQGGGHYDRWLAAHPETLAIGMAWDCQLCEELPVEDHDRKLTAVVTPTRLYGPFANVRRA